MVHSSDYTVGVSVIVPCYNAGKFLDDAVNSVLSQQTSIPFEVIIVDDGSSDSQTLERVRYWNSLSKDLPVKVIKHDKNRGLPSARNTAIRATKYPYILPLDADDQLVLPSEIDGGLGFIDLGARRFEENPNIDVISPQAYFFGNVKGPMRFPKVNEKRLLYKNHIPACSMIRKSTLEAVGLYNEDMFFAEDWDLWISIANHSLMEGRSSGFDRIDRHLVKIRTHADGSSLSASFRSVNTWPFKKMIEHSPEIFEHHFPSVPKNLLPSYLLTRKLQYLGKLGLKSIWSQNAGTFMGNKFATAHAMLKRFIPDT